MRKCPVCGWGIRNKRVGVMAGAEPGTVCCAKCAGKPRK
jgi:hypothetical protein